jgi:copper chaperone NosL
VKRISNLCLWGCLALLALLAACSGGPDTGPGEVRWDKVSCERCIMSISDRNFSAQVRGGPADRKSRLYYFDDFGCAVLWLQEQAWREDSRTEIWVTDADTGQWLDATTATFGSGFITPMDFGLGARASISGNQNQLSYEQAVQSVLEFEANGRRTGGR